MHITLPTLDSALRIKSSEDGRYGLKYLGGLVVAVKVLLNRSTEVLLAPSAVGEDRITFLSTTWLVSSTRKVNPTKVIWCQLH